MERMTTYKEALKISMERYKELEEENKSLGSDVSVYKSQMDAYKKKYLALLKANTELDAENQKLKETIKDHQLYEEKLEHRIIEFEELLHGE